MPQPEGTSLWENVEAFLENAMRWVTDHQAEIEAFVTWGVVGSTGREAGLYVPFDATAWKEIAALNEREKRPDDFDHEGQILALYGPGGAAFETLKQELRSAPALADRRQEVEEVLSSLIDGRFFVTVCGALPLVEYVLSASAGRWRDPRDHVEKLEEHLDNSLNPEAQAELLVEMTALEMVLSQIPEIWKPGRHTIGAVNASLNRHLALHGTARGWDDRANATRAVLLIAAAAKVSKPRL